MRVSVFLMKKHLVYFREKLLKNMQNCSEAWRLELHATNIRRAPCNLSCNSCTISDQEQTVPVCATPAAVWTLSVKQGPTRWASRSSTVLRFLTAWLDSLASVLHFTGLRCSSSVSPERPKNISHAPIKHFFPSLVSLWWENPPLLFPVFTAQSAEAKLWQEDTSPNRQMSRQFWRVCHESFFRIIPKISMAKAVTSSPCAHTSLHKTKY